MEQTHPVTIRLPSELHRALREIADAESRSMGKQATHFLRQKIAEYRRDEETDHEGSL